ncbi:MAG TPA: rRNA maturation RNase YbeY [Wenzhouxiangella sp.]
MSKQNDILLSEDDDPFSIQLATEGEALPSEIDFKRWIVAALDTLERAQPLDPSIPWINIRIVDEAESAELNAQWREKEGPTNVLSFPADVPGFLGDVVLCAPVVIKEAMAQNKDPQDHWAHLTIHGVLHLMGFDHQSPGEAEIMETHEVRLLQALGINNPYLER